LLNMMIYSSIHFPENDIIFVLLHAWIMLNCVYTLHFLYSFISLWSISLIP
jgi:hypothetical protein